MELDEIFFKLVGPVRGIGEHNQDQKRLENLRTLTSLTEKLLDAIREAARDAGSHEHSVDAIGTYASGFLHEVHEDTAP